MFIRRGRIGVHKETGLEGKAKIIFPIVITAIIVFIVSAVVTFVNIGLQQAFVSSWLRAFVIGWPVAAMVAYFAIPFARAVTGRLVARLGG